jgi:hypothetical protein
VTDRTSDQPAPITAYHGTLSGTTIRKFDAYTHFGSHDAAQFRIREALKLQDETRPWGMSGKAEEAPAIYRVELTLRNPVEISDGLLDLEDQVRDLLTRKVIGQATADRLMDLSEDADLIDEMVARGYDGFSYINSWEDAGSVSWVTFRADQARIVTVEAIDAEMEMTATSAVHPGKP